jgi:hypothetical protein
VIRTWTARDCHLNEATVSQTITVVDTTPPVIDGVGEDQTIECPEAPVFSVPTASDDCDAEPELGFTTLDGRDGCGLGSVTRTWTAQDCSGLETTASQVITVVDTVAPTLAIPGPVTVECGGDTSPASTGEGAGWDACGDAAVTWSDSTAPGCGATGTITRTWTATDCHENATTGTQTVTIVDTTAPALTCPADLVLECDGAGNTAEIAAWLAQAVATDACGSAAVTHDYTGLSEGCGATGQTVVTFTATDPCGLTTTCERTITIIDTVPPVVGPANVLESFCLWPANGHYYCFRQSDFPTQFEDDCQPLAADEWVFTGCVHDEAPDLDAPECVVTDEGRSICVRAKREQHDRDGRHYQILAAAVDSCGNGSGDVVVGSVDVPRNKPKKGEPACLYPDVQEP